MLSSNFLSSLSTKWLIVFMEWIRTKLSIHRRNSSTNFYYWLYICTPICISNTHCVLDNWALKKDLDFGACASDHNTILRWMAQPSWSSATSVWYTAAQNMRVTTVALHAMTESPEIIELTTKWIMSLTGHTGSDGNWHSYLCQNTTRSLYCRLIKQIAL